MRSISDETVAIHADRLFPPSSSRPAVAPIVQASLYAFDDVAHVDRVWDGYEQGFVYARSGHPNQAHLEAVVARLEGADAALAVASGNAAVVAAILAVAGAGDHLVVTRYLYGGTWSLLEKQVRRLGIEVTYVDPNDPGAVAAAFRHNTRLYLVETLSNPNVLACDLAAAAEAAHRHGALLLADNTFAGPAVCRPLEHGADLVMESATKYLVGHGDAMGGVLAGPAALIARARLAARDLGPTLDAFAAWLIVRGLKTYFLRMARHCENAQAVAEHLARRPEVAWVSYPGLPDHPQHALCRRQLRGGSGGMMSFELAGGRAAVDAFERGVELIENVPSLADVTTIYMHSWTASHRYLPEDERRAAGVTEGLIRLSVGIEPVEDLLADLDRGLAAAGRAG